MIAVHFADPNKEPDMPTDSRYQITDSIRALNEQHLVDMERSEPLALPEGEKPNEDAPVIIQRKLSLFEVQQLVGKAVDPTVSDMDGPGTIRNLQRASDVLAKDYDGWKYRIPLTLIVRLMTDAAHLAEEGKKKSLDTPSSSATDSQPASTPSTLSKAPRKSKRSNTSASSPRTASRSIPRSKRK